MSAVRIATRRSELALWQARYVAGRIEKELGRETELVPLTTTGDRWSAEGRDAAPQSGHHGEEQRPSKSDRPPPRMRGRSIRIPLIQHFDHAPTRRVWPSRTAPGKSG